MAFSPDGKLIATGSARDNYASIFEVRTGRELSRLPHDRNVYAAAFSPDSKMVVSWSPDNTARVFEAQTGREIARLVHQGYVFDAVFSPNGELIATGSRDKTSRVFEARTGREIARLVHENEVTEVTFSPDGKLVATASADKTSRIFEARTGRELARLAIGDPIHRIDSMPDGHFLRVASAEQIVNFSNAFFRADQEILHISQDYFHVSDLIMEACSKLERNLSPEEWVAYMGGASYHRSCQRLNPAIVGDPVKQDQTLEPPTGERVAAPEINSPNLSPTQQEARQPPPVRIGGGNTGAHQQLFLSNPLDVNRGTSFPVIVSVNNQDLFQAEFVIEYDDKILRFESFALGPSFPTHDVVGVDGHIVASIVLPRGRLPSGGTGVLGTITFQALVKGTFEIRVTPRNLLNSREPFIEGFLGPAISGGQVIDAAP